METAGLHQNVGACLQEYTATHPTSHRREKGGSLGSEQGTSRCVVPLLSKLTVPVRSVQALAAAEGVLLVPVTQP
jgi:hypothetical protein